MIDTPFRRVLAHTSPLVVRGYGYLGLHPNHLTCGALLLSIIAAIACGSGNTAVALGSWWLGRLLDGTDGLYARGSNQQSDFGAYLDILGDMAGYSLMIFGFMHLHPALAWTWLSILFCYVLCICSALALGALCDKRSLADHDNRGLRLSAGLAEGGETGIAYTLFLLLPQHIEVLTMGWLVILGITIVARTLLARKILNDLPA